MWSHDSGCSLRAFIEATGCKSPVSQTVAILDGSDIFSLVFTTTYVGRSKKREISANIPANLVQLHTSVPSSQPR